MTVEVSFAVNTLSTSCAMIGEDSLMSLDVSHQVFLQGEGAITNVTARRGGLSWNGMWL